MDKNDHYYNHLHPSQLKDKDLFLTATYNIENSFTGRVDLLTTGLHRFFLESSKLMRNAIKLYEEGFFDAAFYSVRSALELARIVAYFSDDNEIQNSEEYKSWRTGGKFPFDSKIRKQLETSGSVYIEIHEALKTFFDEQRDRLPLVQKYIHKQGYRTFYERGFVNHDREKQRREIIGTDFYEFLSNSLAEVAFLRLCIDPFPILLRDPEVMYKIHFQGMTEAFGDDFVTKIIGEENVERYCSTEFYRSHINYFAENENVSEEMHNFINYQFYDRKSWKIIEPQMHLLSEKDAVAVKIFNTSDQIVSVYMLGGFIHYFSDVSSPGGYTGFSSEDLLKVKDSETKINSNYKSSFMSYFNFKEDDLWIEHNECLTERDISEIKNLLE